VTYKMSGRASRATERVGRFLTRALVGAILVLVVAEVDKLAGSLHSFSAYVEMLLVLLAGWYIGEDPEKDEP
jgi:branched-subunit amino acid permease